VTTTIQIAPVRKSVVVQASPERAFEVFTAGINRWWPKTHGIGKAPIRESFIEPYAGGRWYTKCEDGADVVVGHVRLWQPPERLVMSFEVTADFKPEPHPAFASEVEVRFVALSEGQTRVEVEHRDFERMGATAGEKMQGAVEGWAALLELFAKQLAA